MSQSIPQIAPEQYVILSLLGSGGMSSVYLARQRDMDRMVAIKVLQKHLMFDLKSLQRFKNEAAWTSKLQHPNIVTVYSLGVWGEQPFIVMEYVEGRALSDVIRSEAPLDVERVCNIGQQILSALGMAHSESIVHRDLKPQNVMIVTKPDGEEEVKILDFGVAKLVDECREQSQKLTGTGVLIGSPLYMSPEQFKGEPVDARSDLYAVSCILCEALLGKTPYKGDDILQLMQEHMKDGVPQFGEILPNHSVPGEIERVLRKGMSKTPSQRYQTADEFSRALKGAFDARGAPARRRIFFPLRTALVVIALCLIGTIAFFYLSGQYDTPAPIHSSKLQMNNEDLRQCLLQDDVWDATRERLNVEGDKALVEQCLAYADSIPDPKLRPQFKAKALFRKMQFYTDLANEESRRVPAGTVSSESRRFSVLAEGFGLQAIDIINNSGFIPDRENALRIVYTRVGGLLNSHAKYEEARRVLEQGIPIFDKSNSRVGDYLWHYHELRRSAFCQRDWEACAKYATKTLEYLPASVEGVYEGFETLVLEAVDAVCVSEASTRKKYVIPPAKVLQLLDTAARGATGLSHYEHRESWLEGLPKLKAVLKSPEFRAKVILQVGQHAFQRQDWSRAERTYKEALQAQDKSGKASNDPQRIAILFHIAQSLMMQEKFEQSVKILKTIVQSAPPKKENIGYFLGSIVDICNNEWVQGRYAQALSAFDDGLVEWKKFPTSFEKENARVFLIQHKCAYLIRLGRHADVVKELEELVKVIPDQYPRLKASTEGLMTESYIAMGQFDKADAHCRATMRYVRREPALDCAQVIFRIINYFSGVGKKDKAEEMAVFLRQLATEQSWTDVQFSCLVYLAKCSINSSQAKQYLDEAMKFADTNQPALQGSPFATGCLIQLGTRLKEENPELALKYYKQAIKTGASIEECQFLVANSFGLLAELYTQRGEAQEAERCFFEARRRYSANYRLDRSAGLTALSYATYLQRMNNTKAAVALNKKLVHDIETPVLVPDQRDIVIAACKNLARIYTDEGLQDEAKKFADQASRLEKM